MSCGHHFLQHSGDTVYKPTGGEESQQNLDSGLENGLDAQLGVTVLIVNTQLIPSL